MAAPRLISRAQLSRLAKVSDAAISKACRTKLADACDGKLVNADHPTVLAYLASKGAKPLSRGPAPQELTPPARSRRRSPPEAQKVKAKPAARTDRAEPRLAPPAKPRRRSPLEAASKPAARTDRAEPRGDTDEDIKNVDLSDTGEPSDDWTLREITDVFGTHTRFARWLDARKKLADIKEKDLKNWETEGELIPREQVRVHIFGAIEECNKRLLLDVPKNLARTLYGLANSGTPAEEAEKIVRDKISALLRPVKEKAARALRKKPVQ